MTQAEPRSIHVGLHVHRFPWQDWRGGAKGSIIYGGRKSGSSTDPPDRSRVNRAEQPRFSPLSRKHWREPPTCHAPIIVATIERRCVTGRKEPILFFPFFFFFTSLWKRVEWMRSSTEDQAPAPETEFAFFFSFVMDSSGIRMEIYLDFRRGIYGETRSVKFVLCCVERG